MTPSRDDRRDGRRRHRHERRGRRRKRRDAERESAYDEIDEALLTPDERALREARRTAEAKVEATREAFRFSIIAILLLVFLPPVGVIVLIFWGLPHMRRFYRLWVEPRMRERFLREEVQKQVHAHLSHERQELHGEHSRSMQELSASIAHEIRNPITAAKSLVQQMGEDTAARENVEYAKVALEELSRVERSVSHLLRFARDEELQRAEIVLADVVESALETFRDRIDRGGVQVLLRADAESRLEADPGKLRRVLINLVGNALDALEQSPPTQPELAIETGENLAGSAVWIRVRDNGPGVDEEASRKLFEPFFTSKPGGTGLGLAITRKLVEAHGGSIELARAESGDSEFLVTLPKRPPAEGGES